MSLENATYFNTLDPSQPAGSDRGGTSAAHIKLLKATCQNTFPAVKGPVTASHTDLSLGFTPIYGVIDFYGPVSAIPANWHLCDGSVVTIAGVAFTLPDCRDRVSVGAGTTYTLGQWIGSSTQTPTITVSGTSLTVDQLPSHSHGVNDGGHAHQMNAITTAQAGTPGQGTTNQSAAYPGQPFVSSGGGNATTPSGANISIQSTGSGNPHYHASSITSISTLQPSIAAYKIMRIA